MVCSRPGHPHRFAQPEGQRHDQQHQGRQRQQGGLPAQPSDQLALDRHHQELAEGAGRRRHAHGPGAPLRRDLPADDAVDHGIGRAGLGRADQHAGCQREEQRRRRQRHARQPQRIAGRPDQQHTEGAELVGQHAGEHAHHAPREVLDGDGQREGLPRPALLLGDRLQPQAEAVAHTHRQGDDHGAADQDLLHGKGGSGDGHPATLANPRLQCRPAPARHS